MKMKRVFGLLLCMVLSFTLFPTSVMAAEVMYGSNLVVNGDAEIQKLTGWTMSGTNAGSFLVSEAYDSVIHSMDPSFPIHNTSYVFELYDGGSDRSGTLTQTIDVSNIQSQISAGLVFASFSMEAFGCLSGGYASFSVEEFDSSNTLLSSSDSSTINSDKSWHSETLSFGPLNVSTTKLRISLNAHTSSFAQDFVDFDNIQLKLYTVPTVMTTSVTTFYANSAIMGGNVTADNGSTVTERGVVYSSTDATPTIAESATKVSIDSGTGSFNQSVTGLTPGMTYYVRAYTTNTAGTSYGDTVSFTTNAAPSVTTQAISSITETTATGNGNITSLGAPNPTAYGICWNTSGMPTTSDSKTDSGTASATGAFTASMTGLTAGTTYYVRAYATNTEGTSYGDTVSFTTNAALSVTTQAVSSITQTTATGNGNITSLGAPNPTAYGICWNTNGMPTISDSKTDSGTASATGAFTASMTSLTAGTTYYVRAYATNTEGTSYGDTVSFTTNAVTTDKSSSSGRSPSDRTTVIINGKSKTAGTIETTTNQNGQIMVAVVVDSNKLEGILEAEGTGAIVTIPKISGADISAGTLTGELVKYMENKNATLVVQTDSGTYTIPASEIDIDEIPEQFGSNVSLSDINITVSISEPTASMTKVVENAAQVGGFTIMVPAVEYTITCTYGNQTVNVSGFNAYVERMIAIPDGVDPAKITTAVVVDPDGTVHSVPTRVTMINGKLYVVINSLTNSTYSVIWNPVEFSDMTNHWAKTAVNEMGSRMVVTGVGSGTYEPDRSITRAEFAAIVVRSLGLAQGTTESSFGDVALTDWFNGYVDTATSYSLITGYDSASYGPNDTITREQAMAILARAMKLTGLSVSLTDSEVSTLLANYTDGASVSSYARASVAQCLKAGVVTGSTTTTLSPKAYVTRAEIAVMIQRLLQKSGLI